MNPSDYKGYSNIRKTFFNQDYLIAGNLRFFAGYLVTTQLQKGKKSSAVLLLPSTSNIGDNELLHAETLAQNRITTFVLENELMVAFAAKHLLSTHSHVDPTKIGIGGFSRGGATADMASRQEIYQTLAHDKLPFAFH